MRLRGNSAGFRVATVALLAAASIGLATPAFAADPPLSIVSAGNPVAVDLDLTIDKLVLRNNGTTAVTEADVQFELVLVSNGLLPFDFDDPQTDPACRISDGVSPSYTQECHYPVQIAPGASAEIPVKLRLGPMTTSAASAPTLLKITVGTGADADSTTVGPIDRVKRQADIAIHVAGPLKGRVGDTIDVPWTVTNKGPDGLPDVFFIFTAPPGTEWTGAAAHKCDPPAIPKTKYDCVSDEPLPVGGEIGETWQLKIDSATIGTGGQIWVTSNFYGIPDPYLEIMDPNPADNTIALTVELDTSTASPSPNPTQGSTGGGLSPIADGASPSPTAPVATLPRTGTNLVPVAAVGGIGLAGGALLILVARRRRSGSAA